ncbi:MAG: NACHT domain-containing protein [Leptolyngbyaceae cyanobacterium MAG.088]|nr:NACHT domain-containing protein [Leptolyngbyaceae cyanobacterium MAG.088]
MPSIPLEYLETVATQKGLSPFQKEAFVARLTNIDLTDLVIAKELNISRDRYSSRMTQVYKKFNLPTGKAPGKSKTLFFRVLDMYERDNPSNKEVSKIVHNAIEDLVKDTQIKTRELINERCGFMQILDMSKPIEVEDIFTEVKITKQIPSKRHVELSELVKIAQQRNEPNNHKFNTTRLLEEEVKFSGVDLVENYSRLILLGRPGAGKTTFLKYIAVFVNRSEVLPGFISVYISLKDFQNHSNRITLREHIENDFLRCNVNQESLDRLLRESKIIFLFDGLDEVRKEEFNWVSHQIKEMSQLYSKNRFIITCRLAASEYKFENFLEAEVCEFTEDQVQIFVNNWFASKNSHNKAEKFIRRVSFDEEISELATNPLLLTLLCMVFEDSEDFPQNRAELYQEGLDVLLRKWDISRAVERPETYKNLSKNKKEDLLSKIAYATFEKNEGLFKQKMIESEIRDYIYNLPRSIRAPEDVDLDCHAVLKSIVAQHGLIVEIAKGIYSFSHRTFHEYFVSLKIVKTLDPEEQRKVLASLTTHISDHRWQEVFSLVACMLPNADYLIRLIKNRIDEMIEDNKKVSSFIAWLSKKSCSITSTNKISNLAAISRVFYFNLIIKERKSKWKKLSHDFMLDADLIAILNYSMLIQDNINKKNHNIKKDHKLIFSLISRCIVKSSKEEFKVQLAELTKELANGSEKPKKWWHQKGELWINSFQETILMHRDIGQNWDFTESDIKTLKEYYEVNKLLSTCLNGDCYVSRKVREEINFNILLPVDKYEG